MMFFLPLLASPGTLITAAYVLAAVLPAALLMRYIYRKDSVEKEPASLLISLLLMGVLSALAAIVLEMIGESVLDAMVDANSPRYTVYLAFLVVAVAEEGAKFFFLYRRSWNDPNFNYRFDGIVYAVFVSLGFAAFENVKYVFSYGLSVVLPRAILSIPGHMGFAVYMGVFYARAKLCERSGDRAGCVVNLVAGYLVAVLLHGFYDACCLSGNETAVLAFLGCMIVMYFVTVRVIKREAATDIPL